MNGATGWILKIFLLGILTFSGGPAPARQETGDNVFCWIEGENFTSATQEIKVMRAARLDLTRQDQEIASWFLKRSGWDERSGQNVSAGAYIQLRGGARTYATPDRATYRLELPADGNYYLWLRCSSPPPCTAFCTLWLDQPEPPDRDKFTIINFSYWNIWSWWPWGGQTSNDRAKPHQLKAGWHTLHLGYMNQGFKVDKILVTSDPDFIPYGASQHYYTSTFEYVRVVDLHDNYQKIKAKPPQTGWDPRPPAWWSVSEDKLTGNHIFSLARLADSSKTLERPAMALIKELDFQLFKARASIYVPPAPGPGGQDAMLIFGFKDMQNYHALLWAQRRLQVVQVKGGTAHILKSAPWALTARGKPYHVFLQCLRTTLSVDVDAARVLTLKQPLPPRGQAGVGSHSGGVGFDDINFVPAEDPQAGFDFTANDERALQDWRMIRGGKQGVWTSRDGFHQDDLFLYQAPAWSNSQLRLALLRDQKTPFSPPVPLCRSGALSRVADRATLWQPQAAATQRRAGGIARPSSVGRWQSGQ